MHLSSFLDTEREFAHRLVFKESSRAVWLACSTRASGHRFRKPVPAFAEVDMCVKAAFFYSQILSERRTLQSLEGRTGDS